MYPTFTGASRRPRNVNLSGQKHSNPFAARSGTTTGSAASKTIADAQASRRQRQHEREAAKATQTIQRIWRGHRARKSSKAVWHEELVKLYGCESKIDPGERIVAAFPLLLQSVDAHLPSDRQIVGQFASDLTQVEFEPLTSGRLPNPRLWRLVEILVSVLKSNPASPSPPLLHLLIRIIRMRPRAVLGSLGPYYRLLAAACQNTANVDDGTQAVLRQAAVAPLTPSPSVPATLSPRVYAEFALSFLSTPLETVDKNMAFFVQFIDLDALCRAVVNIYNKAPKGKPDKSPEELLWLLAHVIALQRGLKADIPRPPSYLLAIHTQLSALSAEIRLQVTTGVDASEKKATQLPEFVTNEIRSLVAKDELTKLLDKITLSQDADANGDHTSLLAGYIIVLVRCFPGKADDIRMLLFLANFQKGDEMLPSIQFFWEASSATMLYRRIVASPKGALDFLMQRRYFPAGTAATGSDSAWDREWKIMLLFLELYIFVMRLTDDDDFFYGLNTDSPFVAEARNSPSSRLRVSALRLSALKQLTLFLKNLAFTLHYHATELLHDSSTSSDGARQRTRRPASEGAYNVIPGVDFGAFKSTVTTAIQMLYERDSRRQFLPDGHWLMTSNFDMEDFLSAVVMEETRQRELREKESNWDEDADMDDEESDDDNDPMELGSFNVARAYGQATRRYAMLEQLRRQQQKSRRERMLAAIGPKLEILRNMPYALPFDMRLRIFKQFVHLDKHRRREGFIDPDQWRIHILNQSGSMWDMGNPARGTIRRHTALIERERVFASAFSSFYGLGEGLKEPIQIVFMDQFGEEEAGIDGGGVTKEFLTSVTNEAFSEASRYFMSNKENALYPNPLYLDQVKQNPPLSEMERGSEEWQTYITDLLERYEFLGRIVGKCMYEGILLDVAFAGFFLLKWSLSSSDATYRASINDLREMDEDLYQGMLHLKNYEGDVSQLGLDFTIEDQVSEPGAPVRTVTRSLIPDGANTAVSNENRPLYISYVTRHRLVAQPYLVTRAFLRGLGMIIDPAWLRMFNQNELQRLVGGDSSEIDVEDLRRNTIYAGVYEIGDDKQEHPTVQLFWKVMHSLQDEDRRLVLKYVTSTPRAPLMGFSQLNPRFSIRDGGRDEDRLPSASTCVNLLKLPRYTTMETMRDKLLYAVRSGAGFDLS